MSELFPSDINSKVHHIYDTRITQTFDDQIHQMAKEQREKSKIPLKSHRNFAFRRTTDATLLLSDYRPTEFGNTKIDLTIDGG